MAELVANKSSNVVSNSSNNKTSDVCGVQSNNGLIDLDNLTASNNQLITMCDEPEDEDDLIMTKNTKNELSAEDKSLQEMIESELALRICSASPDDDLASVEDEDEDASRSQPEVTIKKIILEPRQDPLDINAEFIGAEMEHYAIVQDPYTYRNGHASSSSGESRSPERPAESNEDQFDHSEENIAVPHHPPAKLIDEPVRLLQESEALRPEDEVVEDEILVQSESEPGCWPSSETFKFIRTIENSTTIVEQVKTRIVNKHRLEENDESEPVMDEQQAKSASIDFDALSQDVTEDNDILYKKLELAKQKNIWQDSRTANVQLGGGGQFSDDFAVSRREAQEPKEPEEPEEDQHDFLARSKTSLEEITVEDIKNYVDAEVESSRPEANVEDIVDVDPLAVESHKSSDGGLSAELNDEHEEMVRTRSFIGRECEALLRENEREIETSTRNEKNGEAEVAAQEGETGEREEDNRRHLEKDAGLFTADGKSWSSSDGQDEERRECEASSWMTVEEATNARNKLAETMNELSAPVDGSKEPRANDDSTAGEERPNGANTGTETMRTTNGLETLATVETEINFAAARDHVDDDDEDEDEQSHNTTKIDRSFVQNATATTATRLILSGDDIVAPLATPDDESSEFSNVCDTESREEVITSSTVVTSSSTTSTKSSTKTKKKKIEGVAGNDASPTLTPRTKKTKKSKKNDLEKENISVCRSFGDISNMTDVDQTTFGISEQTSETQEKSSFNKFDALSKKTVLHVRSVDAGKVQQQLNSVGQNGDANPNCRSCGKVVFQMEQTKAEGLVWHKNCFRCVQCSKQLNVDNYQSHESTLYCKAHFKELFQPKPVEESDQPASDKPDLGLEELSSLNVKSRFQVFEKTSSDTTNEIERSPSQVVKRSPSILSKLAKFQAKGMDIGVADDSLNGIPYEESSESEEEEEIEETEELDTEIVKSKKAARERPISFTKMDDIKNRWECTSQQGRRESQREARKEEIAGIRSRLFMGKQGKMKEMYQQAVAESERVTKINPTEEIQHSTHARSIKERFERGEPIATSDGEDDSKLKQEKPDEEVIAAGISRKSRSLFLELDASAAKTGRSVTPVNPKTPTDVSRRVRDQMDGSPDREIYRDPDVVRADDRVDEVVHTDTARKMLSIFRQMEEKATKEDIPDGPKPLKRFTPPPEDKFAKATASESEDEEEEEGEESEEEESGEERDPNYVRASDKVEDEFLKQAQNAARAKTLRAKFEQWETTDGKVTSHHVAEMDMAQGNGDQASIESASSLRARFESLGSQPSDSPRAPKVKVNRFVEIQTICMDVCESCQKKVYPLEKVETNNKIFHKQCFRCLQCNCVLRMDTFTLNNGKLYCIPHFKQLFIARGNYDEGFGVDPHKNKWAASNTNSTSAAPAAAIAVSNGRGNSVANRV